MDGLVITTIVIFALTVTFGVISYFFKKADDSASFRITAIETKHKEDIQNIERRHLADIEDLRNKHDLDAARLVQIELLIAGKHYDRTDIDALFNLMRTTLSAGFDEMKESISEMKQDIKDIRK
jgi:hypothetical protein